MEKQRKGLDPEDAVRAGASEHSKEDHMLWTISVVLIILWLLGFVSNYDGWVYPYFTCDRNCSDLSQNHSGAKNHIDRIFGQETLGTSYSSVSV
jgi:hypothetical protein